MRRNRLIYTLADAAFVVSSGLTGGTFTGATEALKAGWLPLFVAADSKTSGNEALIATGAIALHRRELEEFDLESRLAEATPTEQLAVEWEGAGSPAGVRPIEAGSYEAIEADLDVQSEIEGIRDAAAVSPEVPMGDLFTLIWPSLALFLGTPRSERDVAEQFVIEVAQARSWLKRAVSEQLATASKRPVRYQLSDSRPLSLLDAADNDRGTRES